MSPYWTIPRCFEGVTVAVLASGPSMNRGVADAVREADIPTIAVNTTFRLAPWAWAMYAADTEWWQHPDHRDALGFAGLKLGIDNHSGRLMAGRGVLYLQRQPETCFDIASQDCVATFGNSGAQALQIAIKTGAERVLLCGFDMRAAKDADHWHGAHPHGLRQTSQENYSGWVRRIAKAAPAMLSKSRIVNCTPGSALGCFPRSTLETELACAPSTC